MNKEINMKNILVTASIFLFAGCSSTGLMYPYIHHDFSKTETYKDVYSPNLNTVSTVEVGENIYSKSYLFYGNTSKVTLTTPAVGSGFGYSVDTTKSNEITKGILYRWAKVGQDNINTMCLSGSSICLSDPNKTGSFTHFGIGAQVASSKLNAPAKYVISPSDPVIGEDSFKYTALYQGKTGDSIKISFREFKNDMARPAFTQDIDYQINESGETVIGFKGLRIQVLEATNIELTYKVLKDYN